MFANFEFVQHKFDFEIFCDIVIYIAFEINQNHTYIILINLWSINIVILKYTYKFFETFNKKNNTNSKNSTQKIRKKLKIWKFFQCMTKKTKKNWTLYHQFSEIIANHKKKQKIIVFNIKKKYDKNKFKQNFYFQIWIRNKNYYEIID